jgi:hypothetical protein
MAESLRSLSSVLLYGRVMDELRVQYASPKTDPVADSDDGPPPMLGSNNFVHKQLYAGRGQDAKPENQVHIARIYGFSYEGHYYDLPKPALFIVHGDGTLAEGPVPSPKFESQRYSRAPSGVDRTGLGTQAGSYARDLRVWSYDKSDFSIRLDTSTGPLEEILLEPELSGDRLKTQIGAAAMMRMRASAGNAGD